MYKVPELGYAYDALSQYISKDIMMLHHDKHHQAYVDKLNAALEGHSELASRDITDLLANLGDVPEAIRTTVRNNGGGHYNHSLFWKWMLPDGGGEPGGELGEAIIAKYGGFQAFKDEFAAKALGIFGSGWAWLQPDLSIETSPNQDSPIMEGKPEPILGLDVWEHAYYLDYKNSRANYVTAWWNVVDWNFVAERYRAS